jgi:hypothetical protein
MLTLFVAIVSEVSEISTSELTKVSAALQKQALRDFGPAWETYAAVDAFVSLEDVPIGYWPITVEHDIDFPGAAGIHLDKDGQPFALVEYSETWSLTASHELLEMLADPFGNRLIAGQSLKPDQGRVEYLVEVCDPSESNVYGYSVNGVLVSDFYTPSFFDPVAAAGVRYSFTSAITKPREVLPGGYISWHDPVSNHWWQQTYFGAQPSFADLGVFEQQAMSLRAFVDARTEIPELVHGVEEMSPTLVSARASATTSASSTDAKAESWREQIQAIKASRPQ